MNFNTTYPVCFTSNRIKHSKFERYVGLILLSIVERFAPDYAKEQRVRQYEAPPLVIDELGIYGLVIWHLPDHRIYWEKLISFEYVGNRVFELSFQPKNINSKNRKDRISKARITVFKIEEVELFTKLLLEERIESISRADATAS